MDFELTRSQVALQSEVEQVARESVRPTAHERSIKGCWDSGLYRALGKQRWPGVVIPRHYDGLEAGAMEHALIVEALSRHDASLGAAVNLLQQTIMAILRFGTENQKQTYLPQMARGLAFSITGITEAGAGSKLADMSTEAAHDGDGWIVNGTKTEVHIPSEARACLVFAKTPKGISAFLVDTATEGFRVLYERETVGLRGLPMAAVAFEGCRLPTDALLGREGGAHEVFFRSFDLTRIGNAAKCVGIASGALADAVAYAEHRSVGEYKVTDFQGIRWQLAELHCRVEAARMMAFRAAWEYDNTGASTTAAAIAKLLASQAAMDASTAAVQITGSHGCFAEHPFGQYMMDAKVSQITGGTLEVLRNTIARDLLGKSVLGGN